MSDNQIATIGGIVMVVCYLLAYLIGSGKIG